MKGGHPELPEEIRWRLQRADGFLDLHMPARAHAELAQISALYHASPSYRMEALRLAFEEKDWITACALASGLRSDCPDEPAFWIQLAYAKRRAEGLLAARDILDDAEARFPDVATIPFNLACYDCQLGQHEAAMQHLRRACTLDAACHEAALEDEDLRPLWPQLSEGQRRAAL